MNLQSWIGLGFLVPIGVLIVKHWIDAVPRTLCSFCGLSSCDGEDCPLRAAWQDREAAALAKLDASMADTDDLRPWRQFVDSL